MGGSWICACACAKSTGLQALLNSFQYMVSDNTVKGKTNYCLVITEEWFCILYLLTLYTHNHTKSLFCFLIAFESTLICDVSLSEVLKEDQLLSSSSSRRLCIESSLHCLPPAHWKDVDIHPVQSEWRLTDKFKRVAGWHVVKQIFVHTLQLKIMWEAKS